MKIEDYIKENPITPDQEKKAEDERRERMEAQEAQEALKKAQEAQELENKKEPSREAKAKARALYNAVCEGLTRGESPASLLLISLEALAYLHKTPWEKFQEQKEELEAIQGEALGDLGAKGLEISQIEERLRLLNEALDQGSLLPDKRRMLNRSIKANKKRLRELEEKRKALDPSLFPEE